MRHVAWTGQAWAEVALVAAGGAVGCALRYVAALGTAPGSDTLPWSTFAINVLGSFVLGLLVGALPTGAPLRLALGTGLCGGFTTFSTFSTELVGLLERGALARAGAYAVGSVGLGVLAAAAGTALGRGLAAR